MSALTATAVEKIFMDCLFTGNEAATNPVEPPDAAIIVQGVVHNFGFHPARLESHREEVKALLAELPVEFHAKDGGGWSFLNACMTKDNEQWGEHANVEQLLALGIGLGLAKWQMPREMWPILPGGMPYVIVL